MQIIKAARGNITGHFGDTDVPGAHVKRHLGMDVGHGDMAPEDLRVGAPAAGRVIASGWDGTYGNRIILDHGVDVDGDHWTSLLAHLATYTFPADLVVNVDTYLGEMGNTGGDWPVHLHQELRKNGVPVDPEQYLTATSGGTGESIPITNTKALEEALMALGIGYVETSSEGPKYQVPEGNFSKATKVGKDRWAFLREAYRQAGEPLPLVRTNEGVLNSLLNGK